MRHLCDDSNFWDYLNDETQYLVEPGVGNEPTTYALRVRLNQIQAETGGEKHESASLSLPCLIEGGTEWKLVEVRQKCDT